jgi:hypothetical protein
MPSGIFLWNIMCISYVLISQNVKVRKFSFLKNNLLFLIQNYRLATSMKKAVLTPSLLTNINYHKLMFHAGFEYHNHSDDELYLLGFNTVQTVKLTWRFGGTCLHLYVRRVSRARHQFCLLPASCWCLVWVTFRPWWWRTDVTPKHRDLSELHGVTIPRTALFTATTVRTSHPISPIESIYIK